MQSIRSTTWWRVAVLVGSLLVVALAAAGCGSAGGGADTSRDGSTSATSGDARYEATLAKLYAGTYRDPSGPVLDKPAAGKRIWLVSQAMNTEANASVAEGVRAAAEKLGWKVTIYDGKFDSTRMLSGVQQAVAAGADGIVTVYVDCSAVKNGLAQAKQAKIPTINVDGGECETPAFTNTIQYPGFDSYEAFIRAWGGAQAAYAIAKTQGKAKVIMNTETDLQSTRAESEGAYAELKKCSGCEVLGDAEFVGADFGPALQSKISQQLLKHPDANALIVPYDAILTSGGAQAVKSAGRLGKLLVVGGEGSATGIRLIHDGGGMDACIGQPLDMQGWAAMNYLAVIFAGEDTSSVRNGIGLQACDADHNLPPAGKGFQAPVDYKAAYDRLWSIR